MAKRAFEAAERDARVREQQQQEKRLRLQRDMADGRKRQEMERRRAMEQQATFEREDFARVMAEGKASAQQEQDKAAATHARLKNHLGFLQGQIEHKQSKKQRQREEYLEEGRKLRRQHADEIMKLEAIKANKLQGLASAGIDDKYLA